MLFTEPLDDSGITIYRSPIHEIGISSVCNYNKDDLIFVEKPLSILQSLPNRSNVLVCGYCHRFLGSEMTQLKFLEGTIDRTNILHIPSSDFEIFPCKHHCGELYCSSQCCELHHIISHQLLCTGLIPEEEVETSALIKFKVHAIETNEIFLLVADIFAHICNAVYGGSDIVTALSPWEGYVRELWHECAINPPDSDPTEFANTLKNLVSTSWSLLSDVLKLKDRQLDSILSEEYFSRTIGMFERNNVGVRLRNPVLNYIDNLVPNDPSTVQILEVTNNIVNNLDDNSSSDEEYNNNDHGDGENDDDDDDDDDDEEANCLGESHNSDVDDVELTGDNNLDSLRTLIQSNGPDNIFPPLDGTAFYTKICRINHSCEPNCIVKYSCDRKLGLIAKVYCLKKIEVGDELVQSYIDNTLDFESRQEALRDYGFSCKCTKCLQIIENYF
jgi:hypothetical protein